MSNKVKTLTLNSYMDKYGDNKVAPLYVLNRAKPQGNIAFNCVDEMNRAVGVFIPRTFIPQDLTEIVSREGLLLNKDFKRLLGNGRLVIIDNESAKDYFANNKTANRERMRLNGITDLADADNLAPQDGTEIELKGSNDNRSVMMETDNDSVEDIFLRTFMERCDDEEESDDNLVAEFLSRGIDLPQTQLQILLDNVKRPAVRELILEAME